jgi:hypothetical protein
MRIQTDFETSITIDGERLALVIQRLSKDQFTPFEQGVQRMYNPPCLRLLGGRKNDGDEQDRQADGKTFVVGLHEVQRRRREELEGASLRAYEEAESADNAWLLAFVESSVSAYVRVPAGALFVGDRAVLTGAELVDVLWARGDVMREIVGTIYRANTLTAAEKKALRSLSDSMPSSGAAQTVPDGRTPATAVEPARTEGSAVIGAATGSIEGHPSGSLMAATSPSTSAQFGS